MAMILTPLVWLAMVAAGLLLAAFLIPAAFAAIAACFHHGAARAADLVNMAGLLADAAVVFVVIAVASYYARKLGDWLNCPRSVQLGQVEGVRVRAAAQDASFFDLPPHAIEPRSSFRPMGPG